MNEYIGNSNHVEEMQGACGCLSNYYAIDQQRAKSGPRSDVESKKEKKERGRNDDGFLEKRTLKRMRSVGWKGGRERLVCIHSEIWCFHD